jgi:cytoskeletal protein RodZ
MPQKKKEKSEKKDKGKNKLLVILGVIVGVLIVLSLLVSIFFKKIGEKAVELFLSQKTGGNVQIEDQGKKVSYTSDEGNFSAQEGGSLPDQFPSDFPIYPGATIANSWSASGNETQGVSVVWDTDASIKDVSDFYNDKLSNGGWKVSGTFTNESSTTISFEKDSTNGFVGITKGENGKTTISVSLGVKPANGN